MSLTNNYTTPTWTGTTSASIPIGSLTIGREITGTTGGVGIDCSSTNSYDAKFYKDQCDFLRKEVNFWIKKYERSAKKIEQLKIKKVVVNPKKNATTVLFEDGSHVVVRKHPEDPEVDLYSVVAYAIAEKVYGSNSAFKKELKNKVEQLKERSKK